MRFLTLSRVKKTVFLGAIAAAFCAGLLVLMPEKKTSYPKDLSLVSVDAVKIADRIYLLRGAGGNVTVYDSGDDVIIVDTDFAEMASRIDAAIKSVVHRPADIVINTHSHADHRGANAYFANHGAEIIAHEIARDAIITDGYAKASEQDIPTRTLTDRLSLPGGVEIVHVANGHTSGDVVVFFSNANVLATGDLFVNQGFPFISKGGGGSIDGYLEAQDELLSMINEETIIVPGHGAPARISDLRAARMVLFEVRNRVAYLKRQGMSEQQMIDADPMQDFRKQWNYAGLRANHFARIVYNTLPDNPEILPTEIAVERMIASSAKADFSPEKAVSPN